ncbi:MAG: hypothetical protein RIE59_03075 [Imperialibacter sp.]
MKKGRLKEFKYKGGSPLPMSTANQKKSASFTMDYNTDGLVAGSVLDITCAIISQDIDIHIKGATESKELTLEQDVVFVEIEFADNVPPSGKKTNFTIKVSGKLDNTKSDTITVRYL